MKVNGFGFMKLDSFPPGANPYHHELTRMGVSLGNDLVAMMMNHPDQPTKGLVLVNTKTGKRVAVDIDGQQEPVRIKFKSLLEVKDGLFGFKFMEGGGYISDWLHKLPQHSYSVVTVPDKVARCIIEECGLSYESFGNKDFFRYTTDDDVSGMKDEVVISFLYRHDYRWNIYTLR